MPRTPDRFPGVRKDEGLDLESTSTATAEGSIRYSGGIFSLFDSVGEFDPRTGGVGGATGIKAGTVAVGSFTGTPKKASVAFSSPFGSATYSVTVDIVTSTGAKLYNIAVQNKTAGGFDINLGTTRIADLIEVGWQATKQGEQ